jgi:hypothetical protein
MHVGTTDAKFNVFHGTKMLELSIYMQQSMPIGPFQGVNRLWLTVKARSDAPAMLSAYAHAR